MVRFITLTLLLAFISFVSAQLNMINTLAGPITEGVNVTITWSLIGPTTLPGVLQVINRSTQNTTTISETLDLNLLSLNWVVDVVPGQYNLALNDGSGNKFSGSFDVILPPPSTAPAKGPAKGPAKVPAKGPPANGPTPANPPLLVGASNLEGSSSNPQPSQSQTAKSSNTSSSASTKSVYNLLLSLMIVVVSMVHYA